MPGKSFSCRTTLRGQGRPERSAQPPKPESLPPELALMRAARRVLSMEEIILDGAETAVAYVDHLLVEGRQQECR